MPHSVESFELVPPFKGEFTHAKLVKIDDRPWGVEFYRDHERPLRLTYHRYELCLETGHIVTMAEYDALLRAEEGLPPRPDTVVPFTGTTYTAEQRAADIANSPVFAIDDNRLMRIRNHRLQVVNTKSGDVIEDKPLEGRERFLMMKIMALEMIALKLKDELERKQTHE